MLWRKIATSKRSTTVCGVDVGTLSSPTFVTWLLEVIRGYDSYINVSLVNFCTLGISTYKWLVQSPTLSWYFLPLSVIDTWYNAASKGLALTWLLQEGFGYHWITQIAFNRDDPRFIYATSVNGTFSMKDFAGRKTDVFLDTMDYRWFCSGGVCGWHGYLSPFVCLCVNRFWWTALAISRPLQMMFVGGNTGMVCLLDSVGNPVSR